jgi:hypothetical protein
MSQLKINHECLDKSIIKHILYGDTLEKIDIFLANSDLSNKQKEELILLFEEVIDEVSFILNESEPEPEELKIISCEDITSDFKVKETSPE